MKIKTNELTGAALDWAVAKCEGLDYWQPEIGPSQPDYSTDWSQGGPIIEREKIDLEWIGAERCRATYDWLDEPFYEGFGSTPLSAAMCCYVASKLGDEVEVPDGLV